MYNGSLIKLTLDFAIEFRGQMKWDIFKVLREENCQSRILYLINQSLKNKGEINIFPD